jgi:hypothetical protein
MEGRGMEGRMFFFEKKNQKTFVCWPVRRTFVEHGQRDFRGLNLRRHAGASPAWALGVGGLPK